MGIVDRLSDRSGDRGDAEALQRALALLERLRSRDMPEVDARAEAAKHLTALQLRLFDLATGLRDAAVPAPETGFADALEARLRAVGAGAIPLPARRNSFALQRVVGVAAVLIFAAGLLYGGSRSLPGEPLYRVKRSVEAVRVGVASGTAEANVRVDLAERRLDEVDRLIAQARSNVVGTPGRPLAAVASIDDPRLVRLIEQTLQDARDQMERAAPVLISSRDADGLTRLASVARKGQTTVSDVADELPFDIQSPVLETGVSLEEIEFEAEKARAEIEASSAEPTPGPCEPTPSPTATPTASPTPAVSPTPTPTPSPSPTPTPSPSPTPTPEPTPCVTPTPTPTPSPTPAAATEPTPEPKDEATPSPTPRPTAKPAASPEPDPEPEASHSSSGCGWFRELLVLC